MLSDALCSYGDGIDEHTLRMLAAGTLTPAHASAFCGYVKIIRHRYSLDAVVRGDARWPTAPADRDLLYFLAEAFRARLVKELPADRGHASANLRQFAHRAKALLVELAEISLRVVETGLYRRLRHPGYTGSLLIWTGFALASRSAPVVALVAGLLAPVYRRRIAAEEELLARDVPGYDAYRRRTRRLIPFVW